MLTISDLKHLVRCHSIRDSRNYDASTWRNEGNMIRRQRQRVWREYGHRWSNEKAELIPGDYYNTRLRINNKSIEYIPGQYAPTEIWDAVYDYFVQTDQ